MKNTVTKPTLSYTKKKLMWDVTIPDSLGFDFGGQCIASFERPGEAFMFAKALVSSGSSKSARIIDTKSQKIEYVICD
jgi:hypothetical protein